MYPVWDTEIAGFHVRVYPSGHKTFKLKYRVGGGRGGIPRNPGIGSYGSVTTDQARKIAKLWTAEVVRGGDPGGQRASDRESPTMANLCERYLVEYAVPPRKKLSSIAEDERNIRLHVLPALGSKKVASITDADIAKLQRSMQKTPAGANRVRSLLSKIFVLAEAWKMRPHGSNPCRYVKPFPEVKRERFLSGEELGRLAQTLSQCQESRSAVAAIKLLIFTGCRRSEILTLEWDWIDLDRAFMALPDSKTGAKEVLLPAPALQVLRGIDRVDENPYVIVGRHGRNHLTDIERPWQRIRKAAGLQDVRLHDLRHTFAGTGASAGLPLAVISKMLGHSSISVTERYAHLGDQPLRRAVEMVAGSIEAAMKGAGAEIVELRTPSRHRAKKTGA